MFILFIYLFICFFFLLSTFALDHEGSELEKVQQKAEANTILEGVFGTIPSSKEAMLCHENVKDYIDKGAITITNGVSYLPIHVFTLFGHWDMYYSTYVSVQYM